MCGRYTLLQDELDIKQRFDLTKMNATYQPSYNIAPGQQVLAVIHDGEKRRAGYLRWGLVPSWAKDKRVGSNMINARSETIDEKASFKKLLKQKRCLIIADSFYEWKKTEDGKQPMRFQLPNKELFAFAGLWDKWQDGNETLFTCTILTRESTDFMKPVHHRMPVILPQTMEADWLKGSFANKEAVQTFASELVPTELTAYSVSDYVNDAKQNDVTCIAPISMDL